MPVNYQQMHASNQEIIDFFQDDQVVADLLLVHLNILLLESALIDK